MADKKVLRSASSDSNGHFSISAVSGEYYVEIVGIPGMSTFSEPVILHSDRVTQRTFAVSNPLPPGRVRFVLTWGSHPTDLDSSLITPSNCNVYYGRRNCNGDATLDADVTNGFGPETINIVNLKPGIYTYRVHAYSSGAIEESHASVTLYGVQKKPIEFKIENAQHVKDGWWNVCKLQVAADKSIKLLDA